MGLITITVEDDNGLLTVEKFITGRPDERPACDEPTLLKLTDSDLFGTLTPREDEVFDLIAAGLTNQDIADALVLSERSVRTHVSHILNKLCVGSRTQALAFAVAGGRVTADAILNTLAAQKSMRVTYGG